jgi:flagellar motor switch protein FliM
MRKGGNFMGKELTQDEMDDLLNGVDIAMGGKETQNSGIKGQEVLSQDEIKKMLDKIHANDKKDSQDSGTANRPDKFSREQLRAISAIHTQFASLASKSLSERLRTTVTLNVASLDQLYMEEFFGVIPIPSSLGIISILNGGSVLQIDNDIKVAAINIMCNNNDELIKHGTTGIGEKVMVDIYSHLLENLREAWTPVTDLRPKLEKIEYDPQSIKIAPPGEWVLVVTLEVKINDPVIKSLSAQGMMNLCIPYPVIEPVLRNKEM